jgi:hypothetical protein
MSNKLLHKHIISAETAVAFAKDPSFSMSNLDVIIFRKKNPFNA